MKILRVLPLALQDRYVEKKFRTFMGPLDSEKSKGDSGTAVGEELEAA